MNFNIDKLVSKSTELAYRGVDKAKRATPEAKKRARSFKERVAKAYVDGKAAARR